MTVPTPAIVLSAEDAATSMGAAILVTGLVKPTTRSALGDLF